MEGRYFGFYFAYQEREALRGQRGVQGHAGGPWENPGFKNTDLRDLSILF